MFVGYDGRIASYFHLTGEVPVLRLLLFFSTLLILPLAAVAQNAGSPQPLAVVAPAHPITEATLRKYFDVIHLATRNRQKFDLLLAAQKKSLPSWYPDSVWEETVRKLEVIDLVQIALPIYQKYWSEEAGQNSIRLLSNPAGQEYVSRVYDKTVGDAEGRQEALANARAEQDALVHEMLRSVKPEDQRETNAFVRSAEYVRLNHLTVQIAHEVSVAGLVEQKKVIHEHYCPRQDFGSQSGIGARLRRSDRLGLSRT